MHNAQDFSKFSEPFIDVVDHKIWNSQILYNVEEHCWKVLHYSPYFFSLGCFFFVLNHVSTLLPIILFSWEMSHQVLLF